MNKDDVLFLSKLAKELNEQEHDCQAAPRFWGVMTEVTELTLSPVNSDSCSLSIEGEEYNNLSVAIKAAANVLSYNLENDLLITDLSPKEVLLSVKSAKSLEELHEVLQELDVDSAISYYKTENRLTTLTGCFLTKKAAKQHIAQNHYHYTNPRTYAMTAWRNPEFERALNILSQTDWEAELANCKEETTK